MWLGGYDAHFYADAGYGCGSVCGSGFAVYPGNEISPRAVTSLGRRKAEREKRVLCKRMAVVKVRARLSIRFLGLEMPFGVWRTEF